MGHDGTAEAALGQATRAQPNGPVMNRKLNINNLLGRARRARFDNLRTRGLMAAGDKPAVTSSATAPTTSTTTIQRLPDTPASAADFAPYVKLTGGWPIYSGNQIYTCSVTKTLGAATGGVGTVDAFQTSGRAIFYTDSPIVTFGLSGTVVDGSGNRVPWRLIVDGRYYDYTGFTTTASPVYWSLDFTAAGGQKVRRIEIETQGGPAINGGSNGLMPIGRFYIDVKARMWAPPADEVGPRMIVHGDSYTFARQAVTTMMGDGLARVMGDYLGLDDVWCSGFPGGGYIRRGGSNTGDNALERIADATAWSPDLLVIPQGTNDAFNDGTVSAGITISAATTQTQAQAMLTQVRAALPYTPIVVLGPFRPNVARTLHVSYDNAIAAAVAAVNDPFIRFKSTQGLQTGSGYIGNLKSDGNSDVYLSSDAIHPTDRTNSTGDGHDYIGRWASGAVLDALTAMALVA